MMREIWDRTPVVTIRHDGTPPPSADVYDMYVYMCMYVCVHICIYIYIYTL